MKYALLIAEDESIRAGWSDEENQADMEKWFAYTEQMRQAGVHVGGEALMGADAATTVRVTDGKPLTTDGPFAETKEIITGFYLVEVADLDEALDWAAKMPTHGAVEVRPVIDFSQA